MNRPRVDGVIVWRDVGWQMYRVVRPIQVCLWTNFLVGYSQIVGVPRTMRMIQALARRIPLRRGSLEEHREGLDRGLKTFPFLFMRRRQRCLLSGFLLYFTAKRLDLDVTLRFGTKRENGEFLTHCWLLQEGRIRFDSERTDEEYVLLVEYS